MGGGFVAKLPQFIKVCCCVHSTQVEAACTSFFEEHKSCGRLCRQAAPVAMQPAALELAALPGVCADAWSAV